MRFVLTFLFFLFFVNADYYVTDQGRVTFESDASLEKISATSERVRGIINTSNNTFSFVIDMGSFIGFNSSLQKDHFEENYVERDKYPRAVFNGRIIELVNFDHKGVYEIRAKGDFELHGKVVNKIIQAKIIVTSENEFSVRSEFFLNLPEYNIRIPRLVHKKISENIKVKVDIHMKKKNRP